MIRKTASGASRPCRAGHGDLGGFRQLRRGQRQHIYGMTHVWKPELRPKRGRGTGTITTPVRQPTAPGTFPPDGSVCVNPTDGAFSQNFRCTRSYHHIRSQRITAPARGSRAIQHPNWPKPHRPVRRLYVRAVLGKKTRLIGLQ